MTTEPETVRPEDLKPGDRVRVTFDGRVSPSGTHVYDEGGDYMPFPAHATITRLPPPVDPDLLLARRVVADANRTAHPAAYADYANRVEAGDHDDHLEVRIALAAIKLAKEQS